MLQESLKEIREANRPTCKSPKSVKTDQLHCNGHQNWCKTIIDQGWKASSVVLKSSLDFFLTLLNILTLSFLADKYIRPGCTENDISRGDLMKPHFPRQKEMFCNTIGELLWKVTTRNG